jgi:signal transduction histidine kinase
MQQESGHIGIFIITAIFLVLIMGGFIILMLFLHNRKQLKNKKVLENLKSEFDKDLLQVQIEIQENTFMEISREIHDNINLALTVAKLNLNILEGKGQDLKEPIQIISKVITDLTDLSRSINSDVIKECGLLTALSLEFERINKLEKLRIHFQIGGNPLFLDAKKELYIFRIVQEALNNILKHSKASNVAIRMHYEIETLEINIQDDGCGFDKKNLLRKNGMYPSFGFRNMEKRVELLQGQLYVKTAPGMGTHLKLILPIKNVA